MRTTPTIPAASAAPIKVAVATSCGVHAAANPGAPPKNDGADDAIAAHHTAAATSMTSMPMVTATASAPSASSTSRGRGRATGWGEAGPRPQRDRPREEAGPDEDERGVRPVAAVALRGTQLMRP